MATLIITTARQTTRPTTGFWNRLLELVALQRQRTQLRDLTDHELRDIGITRAAAYKEAMRPLWDVPVHWRG